MSYHPKPGLTHNGQINKRKVRLMATTRKARKEARHGTAGTPDEIKVKIEEKRQAIMCEYSAPWFDFSVFQRALAS